jgi:hypothetical protein
MIDGQESDLVQRFRALPDGADTIVQHRDLEILTHDLAGHFHTVVRFDWINLVLNDPGGASSNPVCSSER